MKTRRILALALLVFTATMASAQEEKKIPRLAVVLLPAESLSADETETLSSQLLSAAFRFSSTEGPWQLVLLPSVSALTDSQLTSEAYQLLDKGKNQYRYLQLDEARQTFARAENMLAQKPPLSCERAKVSELYLYWARTLLDSGDEAGARSLLEQIPRFDREARPDPATMPPALVASFDIALDELNARPPASVLLSSEPAQAQLVVDCAEQPSGVVQYQGKDGQPIWLTAETSAGGVRLALKLDKNSRRSLSVFAPAAGTEGQFSQAVAALRAENLSLAGLRAGKSEALDRLAELVEIDLVEVVEMQAAGAERKLQLAFYLPGTGLEGSPQTVALDLSSRPDSGQLAQAQLELASVAATPALLTKVFGQRRRQEPPPTPPVAEATPWYRSWWFWTATSVVLAGVAGGVAAGVLMSGDSPSGRVIITVGRPR